MTVKFSKYLNHKKIKGQKDLIIEKSRTKSIRIGIPRALYYYLYPALWETYFHEIGMETLTSAPSSQQTVELAGLISEAEHCFALKMFDAHISTLSSGVDAVFVPRILSTLAGHISCPKLGALPDAARAGILKNSGVLTVDINEKEEPISKTLLQLGRTLGAEKEKCVPAAEAALKAMREVRKKTITNPDIIEGPLFLVMAHPYILGDAFLTDQIIRKLKIMNVRFESISFTEIEIPESVFKWDISNKMYNYLSGLTNELYAGVIHISTFNCGCDSIFMEFARSILKEKNIPYMVLIMDEHSSYGWINTRLEAFVESVGW